VPPRRQRSARSSERGSRFGGAALSTGADRVMKRTARRRIRHQAKELSPLRPPDGRGLALPLGASIDCDTWR